MIESLRPNVTRPPTAPREFQPPRPIMSLIPSAFLFQSRQEISKLPRNPARRSSLKPLEDVYCIESLQPLDRHRQFARVALGWHEAGLQITCRVTGKQQAVECDAKKLSTSDGLQVWIDTRNTPGVHRANRFCHQIIALPAGGGKNRTEPVVEQIEVARCREKSPIADAETFWANADVRQDGYDLAIWIPAENLNSYDPEQSPVLGFFYAVRDRELGVQTMSVGDEFPYSNDPTLWHSIELVE